MDEIHEFLDPVEEPASEPGALRRLAARLIDGARFGSHLFAARRETAADEDFRPPLEEFH